MGTPLESVLRCFPVAALAVLLACLSSPANAACQPQAGLETTLGPENAGAGWCVTGSVASHDQPHLHFDLPAAGLWRVRMEALPGQTGLALLAAEGTNGSHQIWQGATSRSGGT